MQSGSSTDDTIMPDAPSAFAGTDEIRAILKDHAKEVKEIIQKEIQDLPHVIATHSQYTVASIPRPDSALSSSWKNISWGRNPEQQRPVPPVPSDLQIENTDLRERLQDLNQQFETYKSGVNTRLLEERSRLEQQTAQERQENRRLKDQVSKFRGIILNQGSGASNTVSDAVIIQRFSELRQSIQKIVLKRYDVGLVPTSSSKKEQAKFFDLWSNKRLSSTNLQNRSRGKVFEILYDHVLGCPCFGLDRAISEEKGSDIDIERALAQFETLMTKSLRAHPKEVSEWRVATMRCAELLKLPSDATDRAALAIYNFMLPILPGGKAAEDEAYKLIKSLCDDAFTLVTLMRRSKDTYVVEVPPPNTLVSAFQGAEPQDTERAGSSVSVDSPTTAFCLFGALIKRPEHSPTERMILEVAHVVQYK